jgi:hypothetical protein
MPPAEGGDEPLSQQQYFPLGQLADRPPPGSEPKPAPVLPPSEPAKAEVMVLRRALELRTMTPPDLLAKAAHG